MRQISVSYSGVECDVPPQGIAAFHIDYQVAIPPYTLLNVRRHEEFVAFGMFRRMF
jgi:hypothetical protein